MLELVRLAWTALWERRGRVLGAVAGIAIAFAALMFALSVGNAFRSAALSLFEGLGVNNLFLVGRFTDADIAIVRAYAAPYAAAVVPVAAAPAAVRLPSGRVVSVTLYGVPRAELQGVVPPSAVLQGADEVGGALALVGYGVAFDESTGAQLISPGYPLALTYGGRSFTLVASGLLSAQHPTVLNTLSGIVVERGLFRSITGASGYGVIVVRLRDAAYIKRVESLLKPVFPDAQVISLTSLVETVNQFFLGLELFLGTVSGVSAVITALWLYDTMTISTIQRTKEFGVMRAVGFKRRHITLMVMYEASITALMGLAVGAALMLPLGFIKINFFNFPVSAAPTPAIALGAAALVFAVNVLGALAPAVRAGRMQLVEALRYE